ncbi:EscU/YscU/HrcU family type III secretion system export apparatus switch protein [Thalassobius sp. S69A]|uniref:EscU/YscU/HrcU family type III secretion system export apparatus switch protein n=1 Tax=unclassified Thalassovita TaxID=2619711 RepID=UPI000C0C60C1|nr:flagellar biosynthesis protein FlhB [Paracoccaceae bacterium]MBT26129.1 flagellar biosynthesis protein FlhB [Paracoccaceae bacterium]
MSAEDDSEKSHEPSQRKLDEAKKKGEIARSTDVTTAAAYGGLLLALLIAGAEGARHFGTTMMLLLSQADAISQDMLSGGAHRLTSWLIADTAFSIGAWFGLPAVAAIAAVAAQRAFLFTPSKLQPKLSRVSLISNAKNKFGISGLFEFFKSFLKLSIYSVLLGFFLWAQFPRVSESVQYDPGGIAVLLGELAIQFVLIVVLIMAVFGGIDYFWQRHRHLVKHRMSHKELRDEHKEAEGDPHLKQERRSRAQQVASRQTVAEVKESDVVIVNPTHYSVALKWSRKPGEAPVCAAKGVDALALQIREIARENGIPVYSDPPTARALYAKLEPGDQIHEEHFRAVAVAIRFSEEMREKARKLS